MTTTLKRVARRDIDAGETHTLTNIQRIDAAEVGACTCYKGVGPLKGQDECLSIDGAVDGVGGPKILTSPCGKADAEQARRDHDAAEARKRGDFSQPAPYTTPAENSTNNASVLQQLLTQEAAARDVAAKNMGLLVCPVCGGDDANCPECDGERYVLAKNWAQNSTGAYVKVANADASAARAEMVARNAARALRPSTTTHEDAPKTGNTIADARAEMVARNAARGRR